MDELYNSIRGLAQLNGDPDDLQIVALACDGGYWWLGDPVRVTHRPARSRSDRTHHRGRWRDHRRAGVQDTFQMNPGYYGSLGATASHMPPRPFVFIYLSTV